MNIKYYVLQQHTLDLIAYFCLHFDSILAASDMMLCNTECPDNYQLTILTSQ